MANDKFIKMPDGGRKKLAEEFGVSVQTIWKTLKWSNNSERARKIRAVALERGGTLYQEVGCPAQGVTICHTHGDGGVSRLSRISGQSASGTGSKKEPLNNK